VPWWTSPPPAERRPGRDDERGRWVTPADGREAPHIPQLFGTQSICRFQDFKSAVWVWLVDGTRWDVMRT